MWPNFPMPFASVPCSIWLPHPATTADAYGNYPVSYNETADVETTCVYAPGKSMPNTASDIEDDRPHGTRDFMTFFLPKNVDADLTGALIAAYPADDTTVSGKRYIVQGSPYSYMRSNTPGDYSWAVVGAEYLG